MPLLSLLINVMHPYNASLLKKKKNNNLLLSGIVQRSLTENTTNGRQICSSLSVMKVMSGFFFLFFFFTFLHLADVFLKVTFLSVSISLGNQTYDLGVGSIMLSSLASCQAH